MQQICHINVWMTFKKGTGALGHVHMYTGIFINWVFPSSVFKKISVHMKTQNHTMKHCQEHAKPAGGNIISTVKPCWPIRSLKKFPVGGDNNATSQAKISGFAVYTITLQWVFENIHPGRSFQKCSVSVTAFVCGQTAKPHRKSCGFENTRVRLDRAL